MHKPSIRFSRSQQASLDTITSAMTDGQEVMQTKYQSTIRFSRKHKFPFLIYDNGTDQSVFDYGDHSTKLYFGKVHGDKYQCYSPEAFAGMKEDYPDTPTSEAQETANNMLLIGKYQGGSISELDLPMSVVIKNDEDFIAELVDAINAMSVEEKFSIVDFFAALTEERSSYYIDALADGDTTSLSVDYWTTGITLGFGGTNTITMAFESDDPLSGYHMTVNGDFNELEITFGIPE